MATVDRLNDLLLPERTRLFHIGPPKTASTALQTAAAACRSELLEHGVLYPGRTLSHRSAVASFLGRSIGWVGGGGQDSIIPPSRAWQTVLHEMDAESERRILFGHEYAAGADDATAARFAEAIGPRAHVVITLRDYGSMLPSIWQEHNKAGNTGTFDAWLERVLERPRSQRTIDRVHVRHDQGGLVRRWAGVVGAENVTVVVLDRHDHDHVFNAFEAMLGLPSGLLARAAAAGRANRSLSVPELEMLRRLNAAARRGGVVWPQYQRLIANGAALRMLQSRLPGEDEQRLAIPAQVLDRVLDDARRHVDEIGASGVRVVGDLDSLARTPRTRQADESPHEQVPSVPLDAAVEALTGMLSAAVGAGWDFSEDGPQPAPEQLLRNVTAKQLAQELRSRGVQRARRLPGLAALSRRRDRSVVPAPQVHHPVQLSSREQEPSEQVPAAETSAAA